MNNWVNNQNKLLTWKSCVTCWKDLCLTSPCHSPAATRLPSCWKKMDPCSKLFSSSQSIKLPHNSTFEWYVLSLKCREIAIQHRFPLKLNTLTVAWSPAFLRYPLSEIHGDVRYIALKQLGDNYSNQYVSTFLCATHSEPLRRSVWNSETPRFRSRSSTLHAGDGEFRWEILVNLKSVAHKPRWNFGSGPLSETFGDLGGFEGHKNI
jgi:hypothetical protein